MKRLVAYELSTYGKTLEFMQANFGKVYTSEYFPNLQLGEVHNGILNQDVTKLTFSDSMFDLVTSNQVFEHVLDDLCGFRECRRVLKPGGVFIFSVPLYDTKKTIQIARLEGGEIRWIAEPEYHDSRITGPKSAPTFWRHSMHDIVDRLKSVGFSQVELIDVVISPAQLHPNKVLCATK